MPKQTMATERQVYLSAHDPCFHDIPGLDGLRAISILIVMFSHSGLQSIVPGVFGVTVFFFVSGFLITTLLLNERTALGKVSIARFYARRALRLYPPLLAYVSSMTIVAIVSGKHLDWISLFGALFYFSNYLYALAPEHVAQFGAHLWSLSVEEHFYLVFPIVYLIGVGQNVRAVTFLIIVALAVRLILHGFELRGETYLLVASECRFDSILTGCISALLVRGPNAERIIDLVTRPSSVALALAVILTTFLYREPFFRQTVRFTMQNVALVSVVLAAVFTPRYMPVKSFLNHRIIRWIGVLSYSLYLWHFAMFSAAKSLISSHLTALNYVVGWLGAFVVAVLVYIAIERPLFRARRRFGSHAHEQKAATNSASPWPCQPMAPSANVSTRDSASRAE